MIARTIYAGILLWILSGMHGLAQGDTTGQIYGKVLVDGRPVNRTFEVRLERQDASLVANAYTLGSSDFSFIFEAFDPNEHYYLVIREPGYKELRYPLDMDHFSRRPVSEIRTIYTHNGLVLLELERLPKDEAGPAKLTGSKVVDIRNLKTQIPDEARREYDLAIADFAGGNSETALTHLQKAVELAPEYYDAVNKLGTEYLKAGQYEKAEAMLNRARVLNPKAPSTLTNLGALYLQEGERLASSAAVDADIDAGSKPGEESYRKAVEVLEQVLQLDPLAAHARFYLGTALYRVGDYERAESTLLSALALDRQMYEARLSLVNIYIRQKRYDAALDQISAYLKESPDALRREQIEKLKTQIESALSQQ